MNWIIAFATGYATRRYIEYGDAYFSPPSQHDEWGRLLVGGLPIVTALLTFLILEKSTVKTTS